MSERNRRSSKETNMELPELMDEIQVSERFAISLNRSVAHRDGNTREANTGP
jgi:hypothetical protein